MATGAKRKVVGGDQAMTATLAGDQLVLSYANTGRVAIVDTNTDKVDVLHNPTEASGQAAGQIGPHTVALSAFGFTVWLDTATHRLGIADRSCRIGDSDGGGEHHSGAGVES